MLKRFSGIARLAVLVMLVSLVAFPAGGAPAGNRGLSSGLASRLSGGPLTKYWITRTRTRRRRRSEPGSRPPSAGWPGRGVGDRVRRRDGRRVQLRDVGLPQNEESVDVCASNPST